MVATEAVSKIPLDSRAVELDNGIILANRANSVVGRPAGDGTGSGHLAVDFEEQMAIGEALADPSKGIPEIPLMGDKYWPPTDGEGWEKMEHVHPGLDNSQITVHYLHKIGTNIYDDFKIVFHKYADGRVIE